MSSVLDNVEATLAKAEKVKLEIVQKQARRDQLLERLEKEFSLHSVAEAEAESSRLSKKLASLEDKMESLRVELNEALDA